MGVVLIESLCMQFESFSVCMDLFGHVFPSVGQMGDGSRGVWQWGLSMFDVYTNLIISLVSRGNRLVITSVNGTCYSV